MARPPPPPCARSARGPARRASAYEDFSAFTEHAPGAYALIGARSAAKHICHPHHHPLFDFDEDALEHGVRMFTAAPFTLNALED